MARRQWKFVVSDEHGGERHIRFSRDVVRGVIAMALLGVALIGSAATGSLRPSRSTSADPSLARENARLEGVIAELRSQIDTLRGSLDDLSAKDEYFRLLAGLEPMEADAQAATLVGPEIAPTASRRSLYRFDASATDRAFSLSSEINDMLRRARLLSVSWGEAKDSVQLRYDRLASTPSILPTTGYISSAFSHRRIHPILSRPRPHLGVDIVARRGTPIVAAAKGRVRYVGYAGEYGLTVEIDHGYGYVTRYAHASRATVRAGQPVERGDMIGHVGDTGLAVSPHLHYEVLVNGRQANPRKYIMDFRVVPD